MRSSAIKTIRFLLLLALIFMPSLVFAAGSSSTITITPESNNATYRVMTVSWVADDADGTVPTATTSVAQSQRLRGFKIVRGITDPGATAPTDNYDITITDTYAFDLFNAQLANRDTANSEGACPIMVTECQPELVTTALTFTLTNNSVNDALGTLVILFKNRRQTGGNMPKPNKGESKQDFLKRCTNAASGDADEAFAQCNLDWDNSRNQRSVLSLHMPFEMQKAEKGSDGPDKFLITAYTGKPIDTWFGKIVFDIDGMATKEKIPVLREHERDRVVGFGKSFSDKNNFYVGGEFSNVTGDSKEVRELADEGYPWQASVAIWPKVVEVLEKSTATATVNGREISGPAEIWKQSDVGEVSFVSLGRDDDTAAISLTESEGKVPVNFYHSIELPNATVNSITYYDTNSEDKKMQLTLEILKEQAPEVLAQIQDEAFANGQKDGIEAERKRVSELLDADADPVETRKMIDDGTEASAAFKHFYETEKANRATGLTEMEQEAPESQGTEEPQRVPKPDERPVNEQLAEKARSLAATEGVDLAEAQRRVNAQNPDLVKQWEPITD